MKWSSRWMEGEVWLRVVCYQCFGCTYCLLGRDCVWFGGYVPMFRIYTLTLGTWLRVIWWIGTNVSDLHTDPWDVTACDLVDRYQCFGFTYCPLGRDCLWFGGYVPMFRMYILSLETWLRVIWWILTKVSYVHTVSWDVTACDLMDTYQSFVCTYRLLGRDRVWFDGYVPMFRMYILSLGTWLRVIWWISTNVSVVHTVSWDVTACDLVDTYQYLGYTYCLLGRDCMWFGGYVPMFQMYILSPGRDCVWFDGQVPMYLLSSEFSVLNSTNRS